VRTESHYRGCGAVVAAVCAGFVVVVAGCAGGGGDGQGGLEPVTDPVVVPAVLTGATVKGFVYQGDPPLIVPGPDAAPAGGVPLAGAPLRVVDLKDREVAAATTGEDGAFEVTDLPSGLLVLQVSSDAPGDPPLASVSVTAFPLVTIAVNAQYAVTRDQAVDLALEGVPAGARVAGSLQPLPTGTVVYPRQGKLGATGPSLSDVHEVPSPEWFFFVDLYPYAGFAHEVEYVFVDATSGQVTRVADVHWPPSVNHSTLWSSGEHLYRFPGLALDVLEDVSQIPDGMLPVPTAELVQEPPELVETRLDPLELELHMHNTDPGSVFLIVWQAAPETYRLADCNKIIDKFVTGGKVNYATNVRWIKWQKQTAEYSVDEGLGRFLAALDEFNKAIETRLASGLHSTLVVYITTHAGPGAFCSYKDETGYSYVNPADLKLTTTKACRVRVFLECCYSRSFADGLAKLFNALPPEKRHDYVIYAASGKDEYSYAIPLEIAMLTFMKMGVGGRFTTHAADHLTVGGGDVKGLLNAAGTDIRDDMAWLFGTPDPTQNNMIQHPNAVVKPSEPSWCQVTRSVSFLQVEPPELAFDHVVGQTSCPQQAGAFTVENAGDQTMEWTAASNHTALYVSPPSGSLAASQTAEVDVTFNCSLPEPFETSVTVQASTEDGQSASQDVSVSANIMY